MLLNSKFFSWETDAHFYYPVIIIPILPIQMQKLNSRSCRWWIWRWTRNPTTGSPASRTQNWLTLSFGHADISKWVNTQNLQACSQSSKVTFVKKGMTCIAVPSGLHVSSIRTLFSSHSLGPNQLKFKWNSDLAGFGGDFRNIVKISSKGEYNTFLWSIFFNFGKIRSAVYLCASMELCEVMDSSRLRSRAKNYRLLNYTKSMYVAVHL